MFFIQKRTTIINNNFNKQLFEDAEKLDVSDNKTNDKIKINQINAKSVKSKFAKDIWIVNRASNSVAFEIRFKHEGKRSFANDPGILGLVLPTIFDGTTTKTGEQIYDLIYNKSINIELYAEYDDIILTVRCLNKYRCKSRPLCPQA